MEVGDYNAFCARMAIIMLLILLSCPIMREREREAYNFVIWQMLPFR
jgi:hypothetical protein